MQRQQFWEVMVHISVVHAGKTLMNEVLQLIAARVLVQMKRQVGVIVDVAADRQWEQAAPLRLGHETPPVWA
ncbi:hypothetical protein D3C80_1335840 [compost metagenome]